ncbi:hypothetical protein IEQ34_014267 [Dendrobium chrysotoxum]|uniref:Uncharacterized protein n=1 Tax=Dendrobium chrysotoxum TaxID=161865 RepID=A0AAV7G2K1_DENCH|nr:hypothetical protein IEQ34_014267 [Dendrobium chrysotoxum]
MAQCKMMFFISDPGARIYTMNDWIVDIYLRRFFRYLHRLKKGTYADFGKDNPVYKCYLEFYPGCVKDTAYSVGSFVIGHFYYAWLFYERFQLHYWWKNGMWKDFRVNGGDPCKFLPKKKCANQLLI